MKKLSKHGKATYPADHSPGLRVPKGGSSCASCTYLSTDGKHCTNKYFIRWNKSSKLPAPADEYCSDWWEGKKRVDFSLRKAS